MIFVLSNLLQALYDFNGLNHCMRFSFGISIRSGSIFLINGISPLSMSSFFSRVKVDPSSFKTRNNARFSPPYAMNNNFIGGKFAVPIGFLNSNFIGCVH